MVDHQCRSSATVWDVDNCFKNFQKQCVILSLRKYFNKWGKGGHFEQRKFYNYIYITLSWYKVIFLSNNITDISLLFYRLAYASTANQLNISIDDLFRKVTRKILRISLPITIKKWSNIPLIKIIDTYSKELHIIFIGINICL